TVVATTNNNNNLTVTGPGSKLVNAGNMYIGQNTNSGNQLLIANSGAVYAAVAYLYGSSRATVSDGGSIWSNSSTLIFDSKPGASQVIVTNGGTLCSAGGTFGQTAALTATGNQVVVTGTGSVWISKGGLSVGNNNFANGNQLVVDSGGAAYFLGTINIGPGTGSSNNLVLVTGVGSVVSNNAAITVGYQGVNNQLIITNGATLTSLSGSIGYNGNASYNTAVVAGGAATSVWNVGGALAVGFGNDTPSTGNVLRVEAGGIVTNVTTVDVGRGRVSTDNSLVIANGGMMRSSGLVNIGNNTAGAGRNTIVVTGAGSTWTNTTGGVAFPPAGVAGIGNNLTIANGGRFVDTGNILVNSFGSTLAVTNGGTLIVAGAYDMSLASTAGGGNTVLVIGNGSRMTGLQNMTVGGTGNGGNKVIVSDGGVMNNSSSGNNYIGYGPGSNNQLIVTGTGSVFSSVSDITLGYNTNTSIGNSVLVTNGGQVILGTPATSKGVAAGRVGSSNNTVLVGSGGLLECYSLSANGGGGSGNSISNIGGVIQFYGVTPTISPGVFGAIGVSNGVVSFRGVTTADVFCNQSTKPLNSTNKMVWSGANGFRLNTATNSAGQNYTFTDTMGPTNFARLELFNGSRYNGNVTIGSGGTLGTSSGTNGSLRISGNLTVSGGTLAMTLGGPDDGVSVTGVVNLANATLQVTLGGDPTSLYPFHLVRAAGGLSGRFGTSLIQASYGGTNYTIGVNYSGTDVVLIQGTKGSIFSIR
ncbi:MAG: hypothetical protein WCL16_13065, partial [bacterium]